MASHLSNARQPVYLNYFFLVEIVICSSRKRDVRAVYAHRLYITNKVSFMSRQIFHALYIKLICESYYYIYLYICK